MADFVLPVGAQSVFGTSVGADILKDNLSCDGLDYALHFVLLLRKVRKIITENMVKVASEDNNDRTKDLLQKTKDGFIQKKKNQKLKQMPPGKIALINGSSPSNGKNEAKQQLLNRQKNSDSKKSAEQNTKNSLKGDKKLQEPSKNLKAESEEDDSDSDEDINEGIVLEEHSILQESSETASEDEEESEQDSENEQSLPNILGTSLADDTDEDDDDYEEDETKEVNKGVKMFKGLKSKEKTTDSIEKKIVDESQFSSDSDDEEDDDEEDDEGDFKGDDSDDEEESEEEDENEEDEDDDDDVDDNNDDEGESEDEGDESMLNWETILGTSIVEDDEDDEDFNEPENMDEDDDDDISDEDEDEEEEEKEEKSNSGSNKKEKTVRSLDTSLEEMKEDKRTIFVGNLPKEVTRKQLKKYFKKFGNIDTVRVRGVIGKSMKMPKKVAAIKNDLHPKLKSVYAYIKYKSEESTKAALSMNGKLFDGNHLRVDLASKSNENYDVKKAVFVGNLHFNIEETALRKHFKGCGEIESIRIVRDNHTGIGKGFGYINFKTEDAVTLALELNGTSLLHRELRIKPCSDHPKKEKKDKQKRRPSLAEEEKKSNKKFKNNDEVAVVVHNKKNAMKRLNEKGQKFDAKQTSPQQSKAFQGQTSDGKKKKKANKLEKKKKVMAEKLAAKSKKPSN